MTYFPLISIPSYQSSVCIETRNNVAIRDERFSGWKKVESKGCTIAILIISLIIGVALIGMGFSGLFSTNFHFHHAICINSIILGVALTIPSFVALKLGFKPKSSTANPKNNSKVFVAPFRPIPPIKPVAPVKIHVESTKKEKNAIKQEKEKYKKLVPKGYYSKFNLSNGEIYYVGFYNKSFFGNTVSVEHTLLPEHHLPEGEFSGLTFKEF